MLYRTQAEEPVEIPRRALADPMTRARFLRRRATVPPPLTKTGTIDHDALDEQLREKVALRMDATTVVPPVSEAYLWTFVLMVLFSVCFGIAQGLAGYDLGYQQGRQDAAIESRINAKRSRW